MMSVCCPDKPGRSENEIETTVVDAVIVVHIFVSLCLYVRISNLRKRFKYGMACKQRGEELFSL